ncbi:flagellar basal body rod protein FlgB [Alicyclobacillus macrosporangiidus]|uniref:flagellar basal body rod protein FlgB n=1 Tax=Alicyclobacillus macrosporangiidus TaxID=392015 RepID=UPI000494ED28|nr:flagellar basal body rod protein FlgB [Alicyclobacillus macrosporangiidus]
MDSLQAWLTLMQNALMAADLRQAVYANNIANMDTPGFKRSDVEFESLLQQAMSRTPQVDGLGYTPVTGSYNNFDIQAMSQIQPQVIQDNQTSVDNNGNNVDIDAEMAKLAENQIRYNVLVQLVQGKFNGLRTAIEG